MLVKLLAILVLGLFWYRIGDLLEKSERNFFFGIAAPWTVNNPTIWKKANGFAGRSFKIIAPFVLIGVFLENEFVLLGVMGMVSAVVVFAAYVYGYALYRKDKNQQV